MAESSLYPAIAYRESKVCIYNTFLIIVLLGLGLMYSK